MRGVERRVRRKCDRAGTGVAFDEVRTREEVRSEGVVALENRHETNRTAAFVAFAKRKEGFERVHAVETVPGRSPTSSVHGSSCVRRASSRKSVASSLVTLSHHAVAEASMKCSTPYSIPCRRASRSVNSSVGSGGVDEMEFGRGRRTYVDHDDCFIATASD